jgi:hypothetical protein
VTAYRTAVAAIVSTVIALRYIVMDCIVLPRADARQRPGPQQQSIRP